jgi:carbon-monoxide dehydrogenase small subunit
MLMSLPALIEVACSLNGRQRNLTVPPHRVLADVLRDELGLKGCKVACDAAVCGACTVLVDGAPTAACSTFAFEVDGAEVTTIEGLGEPDAPHLLQQIFLERDAFQCGFCTPGMILTVEALLREHPNPDEATIREWLSGNTCRCTGYQMIVEAVQAAAVAIRVRDAAREIDA